MSAAAQDERRARAVWSGLVEPGDEVAGAVLGALGATDALAWLADARATLEAGGTVDLPGSATSRRRLGTAAARWVRRLDPDADAALDRSLSVLDRHGGSLLVPGDTEWPVGLDDLGASAPPCLWIRGDAQALTAASIALIGARACTTYGEHVTAELAAGVAEAGWTVVSGGAYGIDAAAHRVSLAVGGPTVAVLAGGVDRLHPAGNDLLLRRIADGAGAVVSEVPPGSVPTRGRFLLRNRLIAALTRATVVVEAAWRSGALSTAGHAAALLRPVGAVPGPVTSAASAGCHRLLRDALAVCVTDAREVLELAGQVAAAPPGSDAEVAVLEALTRRTGRQVEHLAAITGLPEPVVRASLGTLELGGQVEQDQGLWRRARPGGQY